MYDYNRDLAAPHQCRQLRALAVMGSKRLPALPMCPPSPKPGSRARIEHGSGIVVPPARRRRGEKLSQAMPRRTHRPGRRVTLRQIGSQPLVEHDEVKFKAFITDEVRKWAEVVKVSGASMN